MLCSRFALGGDDAAYLQSGLAVLWSTVAKSQAGDDLTLAPAALYSPDAVGGIRRGLLRALEAKHKEMEENAADNLDVLVNALGGMLDVPTLKGYAGELGNIRNNGGLNHAALAQGLSKLKGALDANTSGDLAASILDRVNCLTELIKTRARAATAKAEASALQNALEMADANAEASERASAAAKGAERAADARRDVMEGKAAAAEAQREISERAQQAAEAARKIAEDALGESALNVVRLAFKKSKEVAQLKEARDEALRLGRIAEEQRATTEAEAERAKGARDDAEREKKVAEEAETRAKEEADTKAGEAIESERRARDAEASSYYAEGRAELAEAKAAFAATAETVARAVQEATKKERDGYKDAFDALSQEQQDQVTTTVEMYVSTDAPTFLSSAWKELGDLGKSALYAVTLYMMALWAMQQEDSPTLEFQMGGPNLLAPHDDPHVATALVRGLVGQRGPTEPATTAAAADARLAYALPPPAPLAKSLPVARALLERLPAPAEHEVDAALAALAKPLPPPQPTAATATAEGGEAPPAAKRTRVLVLPKPTPTSVLHGALAEFGDNFAVIGATPAAEKDARAGIEPVHEVRWLPQGPRAATMARAAVLEHAIARCGQLLEDPGVAKQPAIAQAVRAAAASLKLQQLEPLYALHEAVAFDDAPHPLGTAAPLVTRPCAVVRGALAYPIDAGVVPVPPGCKPSAHNAEADVKGAMDATRGETNALRNALRREGVAANVFVAPPAEKLGYEPVPRVQATGADGENGIGAMRVQADESTSTVSETRKNSRAAVPVSKPGEVDEAEKRTLRDDLAAAATSEVVYATDFALPTLRRLVNQCIVTLAAVKHGGGGGDDGGATSPISAFLQDQRMQDGGGGVDANDRREALWTEFHRHLSISQDRLWIFVRLLSGSIGGDVNEVITMADEASQQAAKALQAQRVEVAKRVSDTQAKIVESVVSTMLKESKLAFDARADNLVVMDTEARRDLRDLASGASGRPYFEANVAVRNLSEKAEPMKLSALLTNLAAVGAQMQRSLDSTLAQPGLASASLIELSHPSNAYFVSMKTDASTAIRIAHERCNSELAARGVRRRLALWELVEGGCTVLTTRFAEFAGHILVQNRASTGVSAMYVPHVAIETNAHQARVALARLTNAAEVYAARVPPPSFGGGAQTAADVKAARKDAMDHGERIKEHDVGLGTSRGNPRTGYGHLYRAQSASGWWVR